MDSLFDPGRHPPRRIPAEGIEEWLQDRVAAAFAEHPAYGSMPWEEVQRLVFSDADLDGLRRVPMRIGCLILDAAQWRPFVHLAPDGEMVFYRLEMAGPIETGRYRDGRPVPAPSPRLGPLRRRRRRVM
ncbi:MAG TPA: hypothetical protein VI854_05440 [Acidimicrobiia bacterium]|nr:hypothetical protein [Acidimicrobiia bacterium]